MLRWLVALMVFGISLGLAPSAGHAQSVGEVFRKVNPSVVVIRAKGRDVTSAAGGLVRYNETGSGVLISADGKVITAAHVVNAVDEITVELVGGAPVRARVLSSEPRPTSRCSSSTACRPVRRPLAWPTRTWCEWATK